MPPEVPGKPSWTSEPQKQAIGWGSAYHGPQWRLAAQWTRLNQTAVSVTISGAAADLSNPRNGLNVKFGASSSSNCSFSLSANATWAHSLVRGVIRSRPDAQNADTTNTGLQISGSAEAGSITFLFAADRSVNVDLLSENSGLNVTFVRSFCLHRCSCVPVMRCLVTGHAVEHASDICSWIECFPRPFQCVSMSLRFLCCSLVASVSVPLCTSPLQCPLSWRSCSCSDRSRGLLC
jgi:hypothetical protein